MPLIEKTAREDPKIAVLLEGKTVRRSWSCRASWSISWWDK